ncbi:hypothetical protein FEZ33_00495 [Ruoffia tabacinasalis]|uniref:Uncharacterized protein n=1 Tax=Ruoffia tabacinasalis TaxID=87458 RepID=A0A5R9EH32_9LACT|nr:hypothetical protein [Ruoffia tabacinasalis]TLQ49500.1 hypothetical protein FEZ33_00495 [Ruoffia tabacinasalis]
MKENENGVDQVGNILLRNLSDQNKNNLIHLQLKSEFTSLNSYLIFVLESHIEERITKNINSEFIEHEKDLIAAVKENTKAVTTLLTQLYND